MAYLHVITHNKGAIRFYKKHRFWQIRKLSNFYMLSEDKGPEKGRVRFCPLRMSAAFESVLTTGA